MRSPGTRQAENLGGQIPLCISLGCGQEQRGHCLVPPPPRANYSPPSYPLYPHPILILVQKRPSHYEQGKASHKRVSTGGWMAMPTSFTRDEGRSLTDGACMCVCLVCFSCSRQILGCLIHDLSESLPSYWKTNQNMDPKAMPRRVKPQEQLLGWYHQELDQKGMLDPRWKPRSLAQRPTLLFSHPEP